MYSDDEGETWQKNRTANCSLSWSTGGAGNDHEPSLVEYARQTAELYRTRLGRM